MRLLFLLFVTAALAGCSGGDSDPPSDDPTATPTTSTPSAPSPTATSGSGPKTWEVDIQGFAFSPADLDVKVGDTVRWTNRDSAAHTVDSTDGGPLDSGNMGNGQTYSFTFDEAGSFAYRCDIHTGMRGTVTAS